ncbi:hypothetical protein [Mycolicibacterium neoaurum]|uniref:hypothetical protein n=1 Tax=Mycolicibacterium neoaurum TaxID=1795 RepID=UPI003B8A9989
MTHPMGEDFEEFTGAARVPEEGSVTIDCDDCAVRGPGCQDCVVSVLLGVPETLLDDERQALEVLADVGLAPRLRLVPIRRNGATDGRTGVA